jgi:lauroyl/myristoyl acyltransferase
VPRDTGLRFVESHRLASSVLARFFARKARSPTNHEGIAYQKKAAIYPLSSDQPAKILRSQA